MNLAIIGFNPATVDNLITTLSTAVKNVDFYSFNNFSEAQNAFMRRKTIEYHRLWIFQDAIETCKDNLLFDFVDLIISNYPSTTVISFMRDKELAQYVASLFPVQNSLHHLSTGVIDAHTLASFATDSIESLSKKYKNNLVRYNTNDEDTIPIENKEKEKKKKGLFGGLFKKKNKQNPVDNVSEDAQNINQGSVVSPYADMPKTEVNENDLHYTVMGEDGIPINPSDNGDVGIVEIGANEVDSQVEVNLIERNDTCDGDMVQDTYSHEPDNNDGNNIGENENIGDTFNETVELGETEQSVEKADEINESDDTDEAEAMETFEGKANEFFENLSKLNDSSLSDAYLESESEIDGDVGDEQVKDVFSEIPVDLEPSSITECGEDIETVEDVVSLEQDLQNILKDDTIESITEDIEKQEFDTNFNSLDNTKVSANDDIEEATVIDTGLISLNDIHKRDKVATRNSSLINKYGKKCILVTGGSGVTKFALNLASCIKDCLYVDLNVEEHNSIFTLGVDYHRSIPEAKKHGLKNFALNKGVSLEQVVDYYVKGSFGVLSSTFTDTFVDSDFEVVMEGLMEQSTFDTIIIDCPIDYLDNLSDYFRDIFTIIVSDGFLASFFKLFQNLYSCVDEKYVKQLLSNACFVAHSSISPEDFKDNLNDFLDNWDLDIPFVNSLPFAGHTNRAKGVHNFLMQLEG